jgi:nucleotide-binding universal stress UspA family protein
MSNPESPSPNPPTTPAGRHEVTFQKILVATDAAEESPIMIDCAVKIAKLGATDIVLLHVIEITRSELNPSVFGSLTGIQSKIDARRQEALNRLKSLYEKIKTPPLECQTKVRMGIPYEEILDEAEQMAADVIILGHKAALGLGRFLLGSTAERVVRHASCSVFVVRRHQVDGP